MFALFALVCFILAQFSGVHVGSVNLVTLGLMFVAAHLLYEWTPWTRPRH